jgi:predicted nucleotidyltransferase
VVDFERLLAALHGGDVEFIIVGGVAATIHGSARLTSDLDLVYSRTEENIRATVKSLEDLSPYLRGAPPGLPFRFDVETIRRGLNFTLTTEAGPIDLLGEIAGCGGYDDLLPHTLVVEIFGVPVHCVDLETLIRAKRAAGRPKDLEVIAELESLRSGDV